VIAALLLDAEAYPRVLPLLRPQDFFREQNQWCFEACLALADRGEAITHPTVAHELERAGRLDALGGEPYLFELTGKHFTAEGVEAHARIVARDALYRRLIAAAGQIAQAAYEGGPDASRVIAAAEALLLGIRSTEAAGDFRALRDLLDQFLEDPGEAVEGVLVSAVRSGFMDLDALLGGFKRGDLVVLAARTGVGKSSLLLNFARNAAVGQHGTVAFFALEMSADQLAMRLLSAEAGVDATRLRLGMHSEPEEARIMHAIGALGEAAIYIDDSAVLSVPEIRAKCRRLQAESGLDLVVVDYLQLLHGSSLGGENRASELGKITRALKELARELEIPVIAAAQLSRAVESRHPHIPMLSDLRESGSIEQDADIVMFIYREDVYRTPEEWQDEHPDDPGGQHPSGLAQLIVAKHRNGPTGTVTVRFLDRTASFQDLVLRAPPSEYDE
jgi:replicative DNA helicase